MKKMQVSLQQIDELLKTPKRLIRKATDKDVLFVKNKLLLLLNEKYNTKECVSIRKLINEIQFLTVRVERDDDEQITFFYEPPTPRNPRVTLKESGWITIKK